mgnify:CR=1 FL=1
MVCASAIILAASTLQWFALEQREAPRPWPLQVSGTAEGFGSVPLPSAPDGMPEATHALPAEDEGGLPPEELSTNSGEAPFISGSIYPTVTPAPQLAPTRPPLARAASVDAAQLTEAEMIELFRSAGWPEEVIPGALIVARRESSYSPAAIGYTCAVRCLGLLQLDESTWPRYCGMTAEELLTAWGGAVCGLRVYQYDVATGGPPWRQWPNTRP